MERRRDYYTMRELRGGRALAAPRPAPTTPARPPARREPPKEDEVRELRDQLRDLGQDGRA